MKMNLRNVFFGLFASTFLAGCGDATNTPQTKRSKPNTTATTPNDTFVQAPRILAQANPPTTTKPIDPTDGKARATARAKNPLQQALNNDFDKELENKNFEWNQNIVDKAKIFFRKQNIELNHAASITDENGQGQQTLFMFEKPGSQVLALRYRPAKGEEQAYFDLTGFEDGHISNDGLEYEVVNIGDKYRDNNDKPIQKLGHRSVPVVELSTLKLSDESIKSLEEQLSKVGGLNFKQGTDKIHVIQPELRKVRVSQNAKNSIKNSASTNQTTVAIENPPVLRLALRVETTNDIEVILKAKRAEDGNLIEVDTGIPKHLDLDGKPVPNRTSIENKDFKIYQ